MREGVLERGVLARRFERGGHTVGDVEVGPARDRGFRLLPALPPGTQGSLMARPCLSPISHFNREASQSLKAAGPLQSEGWVLAYS